MQLIAHLSKPGYMSPAFTERLVRHVLLRVRHGLLPDCHRTVEQVAELRYLLEKCLKYSIISSGELKDLDTYLLTNLAVENVFADQRYICVV